MRGVKRPFAEVRRPDRPASPSTTRPRGYAADAAVSSTARRRARVIFPACSKCLDPSCVEALFALARARRAQRRRVRRDGSRTPARRGERLSERVDLVVIGGGPAGDAGLVKLHAPERRVILLEKAKGPRHHVGESLLPGLVPVLKELGVFAAVDAAGFPRKIGANYVWGKDREPWENDFNDVNVSVMLKRGALPEKIEYSWQVRRSVYDEILLKRAESLGVEVVRDAVADGILEEGERIAGVRWRGADGAPRETRAALVADCSGQNGFLSRFRRIREYNENLKNVAGYAYYKGAKWKYEFSGHPDKTKIFICSVAAGWFWYIPIDKGIVSIGLVSSVERLKELGGDLEAIYARELAAMPRFPRCS